MRRRMIMTGPVHTGKTTALRQWMARHPEQFAGILAPVIDGQRHLQDISTGEVRGLENPINEADTVRVGPYCFSETVFRWARHRLAKQADILADRWLIIDELGKLEGQGQGLAPTAVEIMRNDRVDNLLVVIRDSLLAQFTADFGPEHYTIISREELSRWP